MKKVDFTKLNSANIAVNNSVDNERVYDIKGNVNYQYGKMASIDSGRVSKNGVDMASFNHWSDNNQQVTWINCPIEEKDDIQRVIDAFVADVKEEIAGTNVTL